MDKHQTVSTALDNITLIDLKIKEKKRSLTSVRDEFRTEIEEANKAIKKKKDKLPVDYRKCGPNNTIKGEINELTDLKRQIINNTKLDFVLEPDQEVE